MSSAPDRTKSLDIGDCPQARAALEQLNRAMAQCLSQGSAQPVSLVKLDADAKRLIAEVLGEGEIQAEIDADRHHPDAVVQETQFPGIWHLRFFDANAFLLDEQLAVGDCPRPIRERPFASAPARIDWPRDFSDAAMNAAAVLAELDAHLGFHAWDPGAAQSSATLGAQGEDSARPTGRVAEFPPHRFNLSMTPQTEEDLGLLERCLGRGPARIVNIGYGRCQIEATAVRPIWRVRHFNDAGRLILDALEISPVPSAVLATTEDLLDSQARLGKILTEIHSS